MTRSLLEDLRAAPVPQLSRESGVALSLCSLEAGRRCEGTLVEFLSDGEKVAAGSLRSSERRSAFVISRALVRMILSTQWRPDITPQDWRFGRTDLGRLMVLGPAHTGIDLSISHSERVVAVAVSDAYDVGVDVEGVDVEPTSPRNADPVVWFVLSPAEQKRLAATPVEDRPSQFLRMWTLKEAFAKCTGAGASLSFERLDTAFEPLGVAVDGNGHHAVAQHWFHQEEWGLGQELHWLAVAVRSR